MPHEKTKCSFCREEHPTAHTIDGPDGIAICDTCLHACAGILLERDNPPLKTELRRVVEAIGANTLFSLRDPLIAHIGRCRDGAPLITLEGRPFNGLEIRPAQLERMASLMQQIAKMGKNHSGKDLLKVVLS